MIDIRIAEHTDKKHWDDFVLNHQMAGPYHLFAWKEAIEFAYRHKSYYLITNDEKGNIQGVLPLILVKAPFLRGILVSLPFCDYGGILASHADTRKRLVEYALDLSDSLKAGLDIRCIEQNPEISSSGSFSVSSHKSRMLLALPENPDVLWNQFKSKLRSQIRRPIKEGLVVRMGTGELIDDFYHVICMNMRELGSPVHSRTWFASVVEAFGEKARVCVVYKDGSPVGSGIVLSCGETLTIPWASTISRYNKFSPNMLLYWEFLKYAVGSGHRFFDFGRSTPGEGTFKFKEQWGAEPFPLFWFEKSTQPISDNGPSTLRTYGEKVWARFPGFFTDTLGPRIRRFITL